MRILANLNVLGTLDIDTVANAGADTDRFLVQDAYGVVKYRTGAELASDIGAGNLAASTLKHVVKLGASISKGQAVYVSSSDGTNMIVSKASNASEATSSKTLGLLETGGVTNDQVNVITEGLLAGLNTSTANAGDPVWLGTDGNLLFGLANKPYAPAHMVFIGIVTRVQQNNGEIFVKVQNGFELQELHNVQITSTPSDNDVLAYDSATGLYKMRSIGAICGYVPMFNPMTTFGDMIYGLASGVPARVAGNFTTTKKYLSQTGIGTDSGTPIWSEISGSEVIGAALTKTDDTNVTLTLGGAHATSLLRAASLTLGWTGQLSISRGGTGLSSLGTSGQLLRVNSGATGLEYWTPTYISAAITSLNGLTAATQTFAVGTSGTDFAISSSTSTHTFNLPTASATNRGALSSADWTTFNSKQNAITLTTTGSSGAATFVSNTLNIPNYTLSGLGGVPTSRTLTINGTTYDLSADRTWTITTGSVTGSGTTNYIPKWTSSSALGDSAITDNGTTVTLVSRALSGTSATFSGTVNAGGAIKTSGQNLVNEASVLKFSQESSTVSQIAAYGATTGTAGTLNIIMKSSDASVNNVAISIASTGASTFSSSVTASSLIKSGGTSAQILAADGSVITAGTNVTISGGTISATGGTTLNGTGFVRMSGITPSYITGTSSQFVKADGSLDSNTYVTGGPYLPLAGGTLSGILYSTYNTASGRSNLSFNVSSTVLGNIHIQNGAGPSGSANQAAITFMGSSTTASQAGIYVLNDGSNGTSMGFATTESYATGPQLFMTASNYGTVNFPRARPTYAGNIILDAANYNSYAPTLTGTGASGTWGINITGNAGTVTINYNNDSASTYQMLWGSGNSVYGTAGIYCNPSTDYLYATSFMASSWFRSTGQSGWYNETYAGGWYMTDTTYLRPYNAKSISMNNASIDYVSQLHFNAGTRFYGENTNYLTFRSDATNAGGIILRDGSSVLKSYFAYYDVNGAGQLNSSGNWAIRYNGGAETSLFHNGTEKLRTTSAGTKVIGNLYVDDNYGNGIVGLYDSTKYQGVFAMGDAYKLSANGTTTGSLYGIAWSHPNAGGVAANLNSHGMLVLINGAFAAAISSSIRAASDMRAPYFYDYNDSTKYLTRNTSSYTSWYMGGSNNGYSGWRVDGGMNLMMHTAGTTAPCGFYHESSGWAILSYVYQAQYLYYNTSEKFRTDAGGIYVTGTVYATGDVIAYYSDIRLKKDIVKIESAMDKIKKLRGVTYTWNDNEVNVVKERAGSRDIGLIAQEVEEIEPLLITEYQTQLNTPSHDAKETADFVPIMSEKYKTIKYEKLVALLVEGMKEQQKQIEELKSQLNK